MFREASGAGIRERARSGVIRGSAAERDGLTVGHGCPGTATLYARRGVPELWLIDVRGKRLTRYRQPVDGAYARVDEVDVRTPVEPDQLPGVQVQLDALFTG